MEHTRSDHQSRPFSKPKLSGPLQRAYDPSEEAIRSYFGSIFAVRRSITHRVLLNYVLRQNSCKSNNFAR